MHVCVFSHAYVIEWKDTHDTDPDVDLLGHNDANALDDNNIELFNGHITGSKLEKKERRNHSHWQEQARRITMVLS